MVRVALTALLLHTAACSFLFSSSSSTGNDGGVEPPPPPCTLPAGALLNPNGTRAAIHATAIAPDCQSYYACGEYSGTFALGTVGLPLPISGDGYVVKFDSTGAAQWATRITGDGENDRCLDLVVSSDTVYLAGTVGDPAVVSDGLTQAEIPGAFANVDSAFVAAINAGTGSPMWATRIGPGRARGIARAGDTLYVAGDDGTRGFLAVMSNIGSAPVLSPVIDFGAFGSANDVIVHDGEIYVAAAVDGISDNEGAACAALSDGLLAAQLRRYRDDGTGVVCTAATIVAGEGNSHGFAVAANGNDLWLAGHIFETLQSPASGVTGIADPDDENLFLARVGLMGETFALPELWLENTDNAGTIRGVAVAANGDVFGAGRIGATLNASGDCLSGFDASVTVAAPGSVDSVERAASGTGPGARLRSITIDSSGTTALIGGDFCGTTMASFIDVKLVNGTNGVATPFLEAVDINALRITLP